MYKSIAKDFTIDFTKYLGKKKDIAKAMVFPVVRCADGIVGV